MRATQQWLSCGQIWYLSAREWIEALPLLILNQQRSREAECGVSYIL
jgi:hypothetical protein